MVSVEVTLGLCPTNTIVWSPSRAMVQVGSVVVPKNFDTLCQVAPAATEPGGGAFAGLGARVPLDRVGEVLQVVDHRRRSRTDRESAFDSSHDRCPWARRPSQVGTRMPADRPRALSAHAGTECRRDDSLPRGVPAPPSRPRWTHVVPTTPRPDRYGAPSVFVFLGSPPLDAGQWSAGRTVSGARQSSARGRTRPGVRGRRRSGCLPRRLPRPRPR